MTARILSADRVGKKFGKLTVVSVSGRKSKQGSAYFHMRCDCGKETEKEGAPVFCGRVTSCGCIRITPKFMQHLQAIGRKGHAMNSAKRGRAIEENLAIRRSWGLDDADDLESDPANFRAARTF